MQGFKNCIHFEFHAFYKDKLTHNGTRYFQTLSSKQPRWAENNTSPFTEYVDEAVSKLSAWLYEPLPTKPTNTAENRNKICCDTDDFMLQAISNYDHEMRMELFSHAVVPAHYFEIEIPLEPGNFHETFFTALRTVSGATSFNAIHPQQILSVCKMVQTKMSKRLMADLKTQAKTAYAIVKGQFDNRGDQNLGTLLTAWLQLEKEIDAFLKEVETVDNSEEDRLILRRDKADIIKLFWNSFSEYFDDHVEKLTAIRNKLVVFNYVLLEKFDIDNQINLNKSVS